MPRQFSVADAALKPFCLGHVKLFKLLKLPFQLDAKDDCSLEDAILCASICSFSYEDGLNMVNSGAWPKVIRRWRRKVVGFGIFKSKLDEEKVIADFREYIEDGYRMPPMYIRDCPNGITLTAPRESMLISRLAPFGYSAVMNMYLPEAWYQYFTSVEISAADNFEGQPKDWRKMFFTAHDAIRLEALDKMRRQENVS